MAAILCRSGERFRRFIGKFFKNFARILGKIGVFLMLIADDFLILAGVCVIVAANFRVNELFGWYSFGLVFIGLGYVGYRARIGRRK